MEDNLQYWQHVLSDRSEDYDFEMLRDEDDILVKLCLEAVIEAEQKIEELTDV